MLLGEPVNRRNFFQTRKSNLDQQDPVNGGAMFTKGRESAIAAVSDRPIEGSIFKVG